MSFSPIFKFKYVLKRKKSIRKHENIFFYVQKKIKKPWEVKGLKLWIFTKKRVKNDLIWQLKAKVTPESCSLTPKTLKLKYY